MTWLGPPCTGCQRANLHPSTGPLCPECLRVAVEEIRPRSLVLCRSCLTVLESKDTHDFQSCPCGTFVDGGPGPSAYRRYGGDAEVIE